VQYLHKSYDELKEEIRGLRALNDSVTSKLSQCDTELFHAAEQLSQSSKEISSIRINHDKASAAEAHINVLKGDIARLIHMLDSFPALRGFMQRWNDSDGLSFVGLGASKTNESIAEPLTRTHPYNLSNIIDDDIISANEDDDEVPLTDRVSALNAHITASRFQHLRRDHDNDPFPILPTDEEQIHWVPRKAADIGIQFLADNLPHAPASVIMEFLRTMNKVNEGRTCEVCAS
jgi:hypothetical protein